MTVRVRLSEADRVDALARRLRSAGCLTARKSSNTLEVVHVEAVDVDEARLEVEFFVRAWQLDYPDVCVEVLA